MSDALASRGSWSLTNGTETEIIDVKSRLLVNDFSTQAIVAANHGEIVSAHPRVVEDLVELGRLVRVLPQWRSPDVSLFAIFPSRLGLSRRVRLWLDFYVDKLSNIDPERK